MVETQIGHFRVLEAIGAGGMGMVYRGVDTRTDAPVAVKRLKPELVASDPSIIDRFAREGEALRQLNHPNIVKMLDALQVGDEHYLVMEYVTGGSLADLLRTEQTLSVSRTLEIALELADALTRAHHLKIIHRDIKPANVLIAADGTPRLTDFGVAHMGKAERITELGAAIGTLHYLSPEALNGEEIDARADLWAFGVMLFEMLVGKLPFDADNITGIVTSILTQPTPDLETLRLDIPVALVDLIYRMLEKNRQVRIPSARLVGAELEAIIQGRDISSVGSRRALSLQPPFDTPTPAPEAVKNNLPPQSTPFVGREEEIAELVKLLDHTNTRLVTILAPGGMGKTRLALEVAVQFVDRNTPQSFTNGVYFVALAPLTSLDFIVSTIADAVGFQFYPGGEPKQQLLDFLREKQTLLVMDNFEHLLDSAELVSDILAYAPGVKVIATSRERLNIGGEVIFALSGMDFPDWETPEDALNYAAVKLFMQSAKRTRPVFELAADDLKYLARICRLVAGMPLGIVLAATWVEMLALKEIAGEIEQSLDFLDTERRDVPERQRSIRGVFEHSWNRLSDHERDVFMKLSVFRGGFTREAVQAVGGASLKTLAGLVNKSLLRRDPAGRYEVHELLRQYGEQQLEASGDVQSVHFAHASYYAEFMARQWVAIKNHGQLLALGEIDLEFENLRTAWHFCIEQDHPVELNKMASSLWFYGDMREKFYQLIDLFGQAIEKLRTAPDREGVPVILGHLMARQGWFYMVKGFQDQAKALAEESLAILAHFNCPEETIMAYETHMMATAFLAQHEESKQSAELGLKVAQAANNTWGIAHSLCWLGMADRNLGQYAEAKTVGEECMKNASEVGNLWIMACGSGLVLGGTAIELKEYVEAKKWVQRSLNLFKQLDKRWGVATATEELGIIAYFLNDFAEARFYYTEGLKMRQKIGRDWETLESVLKIAETFAAMGDKERALELSALILNHPTLSIVGKQWAGKLQTQLQAELPPDVYAAAWERGKTLDLNMVVAELVSEMDTV